MIKPELDLAANVGWKITGRIYGTSDEIEALPFWVHTQHFILFELEQIQYDSE